MLLLPTPHRALILFLDYRRECLVSASLLLKGMALLLASSRASHSASISKKDTGKCLRFALPSNSRVQPLSWMRGVLFRVRNDEERATKAAAGHRASKTAREIGVDEPQHRREKGEKGLNLST